MADHLWPFLDLIIFELKRAKMMKSENGLKWAAIEFLIDSLRTISKKSLQISSVTLQIDYFYCGCQSKNHIYAPD